MKRSRPLKRSPLKPRQTRINRTHKSRFPKIRDQQFIAWIRNQPCALASRTQCDYWFTSSEADHVRTRGAGGQDHANLIPLCRKHHQIRHDVGVKSFAAGYGIDLKALALEYHQRYEAGQHR